MIPFLSQAIQDELTALAQRYGQPLVHIANLDSSNEFDPLNSSDRYGEVCMVVRRRNGRLLTIIKQFYPREAYRLPTGGINHGEPIFDALLRETHEETGLEVQVQRFLAVAMYRTPTTGGAPVFYTFAFLLDETGGTLEALDEEERVEAFREITPEELPQLADHLYHLGNRYSEEIDGSWSNWGKFRSVIHSLVWEALTQQTA